MTGGLRVAVQVGAHAVRVAVAAPGGPPALVATRRAPVVLADLVGELAGPAPGELVVVHPAKARPAEVGALLVAVQELATVVRAVPAPVAAAAGREVAAVLDVGAAGAEATVPASGRCVHVPIGGRALDAAVRPVLGGRSREDLSLHPDTTASRAMTPLLGEVVAALRSVLDEAGSGRPEPVLLIGGVARTPLLAELADAAGVPGVVVPDRPEAAAVLGALLAVASGAGRMGGPPAAVGAPGSGAPRSVGRSAAGREPPIPGRLPSPVRRRRPLRRAALAMGSALAVAGLLAVGGLLDGAAAVPSGVLVQYGYRLDVPAGWVHTGGRPERRRVLLTPTAAPAGSDLIAVEASPLGYDTAAEPARAAAELRAVYDAGRAAGADLSGYAPGAVVAGRPGTAYRERDGAAVVDWFVLLDGDQQLSVGCRHTAAGAVAVTRDCALVVGSLRRA